MNANDLRVRQVYWEANHEVLQLVRAGKSKEQIAEQLGVSITTVHNRLRKALCQSKLSPVERQEQKRQAEHKDHFAAVEREYDQNLVFD
jgi:transposase